MVGRSPRGRGRRAPRSGQPHRKRSIPAWAGETGAATAPPPRRWVDPRVGGGDPPPRPLTEPPCGRSPRGRGRPSSRRRHRRWRRSIPAWAGETDRQGEILPSLAVDPRVGGGDWCAPMKPCWTSGRSPRGRGRRLMSLPDDCHRGSIPAWAGETQAGGSYAIAGGVDPRVGGGDRWPRCVNPDNVGRSPRGRGRPTEPREVQARRRSIPAWAGETVSSAVASRPREVDPRVGGGDAYTSRGRRTPDGRSPRGRGRPKEAAGRSIGRWSIPAWAGETRAASSIAAAMRVDPRVGGGDGSSAAGAGIRRGRSPRGRGRPVKVGRWAGEKGSIPAWAGETDRVLISMYVLRVDPRVGGGDKVKRWGAYCENGRSPRGRGRPP